METKPLLYAIIGFLLGGLLVSIVATTQNKSDQSASQTVSTSQHNQAATDKLKKLQGDAFDKAFITEMIDHHQGAIHMAQLVNKNAKHVELKTLSQAIISAQTSEISMMKAWQAEWSYTSSSKTHDMHSEQQSN